MSNQLNWIQKGDPSAPTFEAVGELADGMRAEYKFSPAVGIQRITCNIFKDDQPIGSSGAVIKGKTVADITADGLSIGVHLHQSLQTMDLSGYNDNAALSAAIKNAATEAAAHQAVARIHQSVAGQSPADQTKAMLQQLVSPTLGEMQPVADPSAGNLDTAFAHHRPLPTRTGTPAITVGQLKAIGQMSGQSNLAQSAMSWAASHRMSDATPLTLAQLKQIEPKIDAPRHQMAFAGNKPVSFADAEKLLKSANQQEPKLSFSKLDKVSLSISGDGSTTLQLRDAKGQAATQKFKSPDEAIRALSAHAAPEQAPALDRQAKLLTNVMAKAAASAKSNMARDPQDFSRLQTRVDHRAALAPASPASSPVTPAAPPRGSLKTGAVAQRTVGSTATIPPSRQNHFAPS